MKKGQLKSWLYNTTIDRQPVWVGILIASVAATAPLTAAVHGWISRSKELAIAERDKAFQVQMAFLDRSVDSSRAPEDRERVLRFLEGVVDDEKMRHWAGEELHRVEVQLHQVNEDLRIETEARDKADVEIDSLKQRLVEAEQTTAEAADIRRALNAMLEQRVRAEANLKEIKAKLSGSAKEPPSDERGTQALRGVTDEKNRCIPGTTVAAELVDDTPSAERLSSPEWARACLEEGSAVLISAPARLWWRLSTKGRSFFCYCAVSPSSATKK